MPRYIKISIILLLSFAGLPSGVKAEEVLTWQDCIKEAQKNNPNLISAQESIKQSKASKNITASALLPQINGNVDASRSKSGGGDSEGASGKITNSYSYGVSGSQLIFDGFKTVDEINAASENIKAAQQSYRFTSSEVRLNLRSAFVNLLKAQELIRVAQEIVDIRKDNLGLISLRYQSGLEHKGALLTAEANLAQADLELSRARRDVVLAQRQLTKEMGRREFTPMSARGDFIVKDTAKEKPDFEVLVKDNPSLLQAVAKKNAADYGIKSAYANFFPQISARAGADKSGSSWLPQNGQWNLGLGLSVPIFEGGLKLAQVSQAKAIFNQAQADERNIKDTAVVNLEQTWRELQDAMETVDVLYKSLIASQERSKIAQAQYSTGFISFDNWIIIEDDLVNAKNLYLAAQANALLAEAGWIQAKGETLEYAD